MKSYVIPSTIPAYPTDRHKDWPVSIRGGCYQNEYSETSALSGPVRSTGDFAVSVQDCEVTVQVTSP